ncbi:hypothetical protein ACJJTC_003679 [Scirpophaga incertulas]
MVAVAKKFWILVFLFSVIDRAKSRVWCCGGAPYAIVELAPRRATDGVPATASLRLKPSLTEKKSYMQKIIEDLQQNSVTKKELQDCIISHGSNQAQLEYRYINNRRGGGYLNKSSLNSGPKALSPDIRSSTHTQRNTNVSQCTIIDNSLMNDIGATGTERSQLHDQRDYVCETVLGKESVIDTEVKPKIDLVEDLNRKLITLDTEIQEDILKSAEFEESQLEREYEDRYEELLSNRGLAERRLEITTKRLLTAEVEALRGMNECRMRNDVVPSSSAQSRDSESRDKPSITRSGRAVRMPSRYRV